MLGEKNPKVAVVLSAYNGERYLAQQIDSILEQDYEGIAIYARDDGSTDSTLDILEEYEQQGELNLQRGENKGVVGSFFSCMRNLPEDVDYIAFADQDDVWHRDKIGRAVHMLQAGQVDVPKLYYSELNYCDDELRFVETSHLNRRGNSFILSLFDNTCSGNTILLNKEAVAYALRSNEAEIYYHDWWFAMVVACFGEIIYDACPSLEYRRTGGNVSPSGKTGIRLLLYRMAEYFSTGNFEKIHLQNCSFLRTFYDDMQLHDRSALELFCSRKRLIKAVYPKRLRQKFSDEILLRTCFLLGKL